jgi:cysteine desulfurase
VTRHYLDHASTSPLRPEVKAAMAASLDELWGDPGRVHTEGMGVRARLETARETVAAFFGARSREVVFCSGATEAIAGATWGARGRGPGDHVVAAAVEHSAVRAATESGPHTIVGVDRAGRVDPADVDAAIRDDTALVHIQWGNHEVGTLQPMAQIVEICRRRGVLVHVDAAAAAGRAPVDFDGLGADLMSVSGHKFGGPPGVGVLLVRRGLRLAPLLAGGDQERARRAGLENVPAIVGLAAACETLAGERLGREAARSRDLTDRIVDAVGDIDGVRSYGDTTGRLPHIVCFGIDDVEPQAVVLGLDRRGVAVHSGSACSSESLEPSVVLEAMGVDAHRSLRVSAGWTTTDDDAYAFIDAFGVVLTELRALRS